MSGGEVDTATLAQTMASIGDYATDNYLRPALASLGIPDPDRYRLAAFIDPLPGMYDPPDDPSPTTGAGIYHEFPAGCVCHIREDIDYGDVLTPPAGGCPAHPRNGPLP